MEARLKAIEDHLSLISAQINQRQDDSRFYYNDNVVVYDSTDTIPSEPPIDDILAYDNVAGMTYVAAGGAWVPISGLTGTIVTKTSAYTTVASDGLVLANAAGGAFTVTLTGTSPGKSVIVKRTNSGANNVTVAAGSGSIDGGSYTLAAQYEFVHVIWDGTNWHKVSWG